MFSPMEERIIKILGKKKMTVGQVTEAYYGDEDPLFAANAIAGTIRRINQKCKYHELDWFIAGVGMGRGGKTVWRMKR